MARIFTSLRSGPPPASAAGSVFAAAAAFPVQAKLTIGAPGDRYERQADQVASRVVNLLHAPAMTEPPPQGTLQRQAKKEDGEEPEISSVAGDETELVQGCDCCGGTCGTPEPEKIETRLRQERKRGGEPFPPTVRQPMEKAFGADFSGVTIHRDRPAHELNHTLQARAFTTGQDIFFRHGEYAPASRRGQELIAHELTHVVQQSGGKRAPAGAGVLQRACTRAECGPDPDPPAAMEIEEQQEEEDIQIQNKPLAGHPFSGAAAVPVATRDLLVQRATAKGALDNTAARNKNLGAAAGAFAGNDGGTVNNNTAIWMTADWLHRQGGGTGVGGRRPDDWNIFKGLADGLNPFCQGHFLSQKLGGRGAYENLAPFTRSLNGLHETQVESEVIDWTKAAGQDEWAHYQVDANYNGNNDVENWALTEYNGMTGNNRKKAAAALPGGPFGTAGAADAVARPWIQQYVQDTFPTDIDCKVKFIEYVGGNYRTNNAWQKVNLTNEFH